MPTTPIRPADPEGPGPFSFALFWGPDRAAVARDAAHLPGEGSAWYDDHDTSRIGELLARFAQAGGVNGELARTMVVSLEQWLDARVEQAKTDPEFGRICERARWAIANFRQYVPEP